MLKTAVAAVNRGRREREIKMTTRSRAFSLSVSLSHLVRCRHRRRSHSALVHAKENGGMCGLCAVVLVLCVLCTALYAPHTRHTASTLTTPLRATLAERDTESDLSACAHSTIHHTATLTTHTTRERERCAGENAARPRGDGQRAL